MHLYRGVVITARMLREARACWAELFLFQAVFPGGRAPLTEANLARAEEAGLTWEWLVQFHPCREVYEVAMSPHREALKVAERLHMEAYEAAKQPLWALWEAHMEAEQLPREALGGARLFSWREYMAATLPHRDAYAKGMQPYWEAFAVAARRLFLETLPEA